MTTIGQMLGSIVIPGEEGEDGALKRKRRNTRTGLDGMGDKGLD